jgi:hypothetical protein
MKTKRLTAALLAGSVMLCSSAFSVHAADAWKPEESGILTGGITVRDLQQADDRGMYSDMSERARLWYTDTQSPYAVYTYHFDQSGYDALYYAAPRRNILRYVLREGPYDETAYNNAIAIASKIMTKYGSDAEPYDLGDNKTFEIQISKQDGTFPQPVGSSDAADEMMTALAQAGLISEFYAWGQTAAYFELEHGYLTAYSAQQCEDWDAVAAWVQENHPECGFICVTDEASDGAETIGLANDEYLRSKCPVYAVTVPEGTAFADHFTLAADLYAEFGLYANARPSPKEDGGGEIIGKNALAIAGDADLNCKVNVIDAVLLARITADAADLSDAELPAQGKANADVTHDGAVNQDDLMKLLRYLSQQITKSELAA